MSDTAQRAVREWTIGVCPDCDALDDDPPTGCRRCEIEGEHQQEVRVLEAEPLLRRVDELANEAARHELWANPESGFSLGSRLQHAAQARGCRVAADALRTALGLNPEEGT